MKYLLLLLTFLGLNCALQAQSSVAFLMPNTTVKTAAENESISVAFEPFERIGNLMIVQGKINGKNGLFLVDTGSPALVINKKVTESDLSGVGFEANYKIGAGQVESFDWGGIKATNVEVLYVDLNHLATALERPLMGMIGHSILNKFETYYDLDNELIKLYPASRNDLHSRDNRPQEQFRFSMMGHLPIIEYKIQGETLRLALDSGSDINLIDSKALQRLNKNAYKKKNKSIELRGLDQQIIKSEKVVVRQLEHSDLNTPELEFAKLELSKIIDQTELDIDGIIGIAGLHDRPISINYRKQKIYLW